MRKIGLWLICLLFCVGIVAAQTEECEDIVAEALEQVDDLCTDLGRNSACYGASDVESETVTLPRPEEFFLKPGDRAELLELSEIFPQPLNAENGSFGVALLNVQADVPNTIPGQSVLFLLTGNARLVNDKTDPSRTPFQAFYFLPGIGQSNCYDADAMLTIQTPGNIAVNIVLNGVDTEMSPGTLLTITGSVCTIHRGNIIQRIGDETAVLLANQTVDIRIEDDGQVVATNLRNISEREFTRGEQAQEILNAIATANGWQEQFVTIPRQFDSEPEASTSPEACDTQHTVRYGETLHRIAEIYNTSVLDIAEANGLDNPRVIYAGQVLCIPHPNSGFEPLPKDYEG